MKKFYFICFCLFLFGGFVSAREWVDVQTKKPAIVEQKKLESSISFPPKKTLKDNIQKIFQIPRTKKTITSDFCFSWKNLLVRDNLSKKAKESSDKVFWLVLLASKINYNVENFQALAQELQVLSSQIAKDCLLSDFQNHREQIKKSLDSLKKEMVSFKKYVANLRNK